MSFMLSARFFDLYVSSCVTWKRLGVCGATYWIYIMPIQDDIDDHWSVRTTVNTNQYEVANNNTYSLYIALKSVHHIKQHGLLFTSTRDEYNTEGDGDLWWFALAYQPRLAIGAANRHKPPPKCRKYAGFGTMVVAKSSCSTRLGYCEGANAVAIVTFSASSGVSQSEGWTMGLITGWSHVLHL